MLKFIRNEKTVAVIRELKNMTDVQSHLPHYDR